MMYFAGSIYKEIKGGKDLIKKAPKNVHFFTNYKGKPAIVSDGRLYVFVKKEDGFRSIWK
jgi:hypothetical protein